VRRNVDCILGRREEGILRKKKKRKDMRGARLGVRQYLEICFSTGQETVENI
jgi:hypothetical protein